MYNRPLIIAHRGESYEAPENTLASINLAWERNADAVEIDVQLSKDKKIVVMHDTNTKRITGINKKVSRQTLEELKKLDAGTFKSFRWKGEKIPSLDEVLLTVPPGRKLIIEIKCGPEIIDQLMNLNLEIYEDKIEYIGFNLKTVSLIKKKFPRHKVFLISNLDYYLHKRIIRPSVDHLISNALKNNLDGLDVWASNIINNKFVEKVKSAGLQLYVWTVNNPLKAKYLIGIGIDGVTTDRAQWLKEKLSL